MAMYVFPVQGSQAIGMVIFLLPNISDYTQKANMVFGCDIEALCLQDSQHLLNKTDDTQLVLYIVNALRIAPEITSVSCIKSERVKMVSSFAPEAEVIPGAILTHLDKNQKTPQAPGFNANAQIVISGPTCDIEQARHFFIQAGASLYLFVKVSGAFHSLFIKDARHECKIFDFAAPKITVIANLDAKPYIEPQVVTHLSHQITHSVCGHKV